MLTVTNAWNQRGWDFNDHLMGNEIQNMIGRQYRDLKALKRIASKLSESYPTVEYHDGYRRYRWAGDPSLPGRQGGGIQDLGPINHEAREPRR